MNSRRAIYCWVLRVVRAEWRQHILVVSMIAFGIAIATLFVTSAFRFQEPLERTNEAPASVELQVLSDEPAASARFEADLLSAYHAFPDTELQVSGPRSIEGPLLLGTDPSAPLGSVNFEIVEGRWPGRGEVGLTQRAVDQLAVFFQEEIQIGQTRAIGGAERTIVGIWENPNNLRSPTALIPIDDLGAWLSARVLLPTSPHEAISAFVAIGTVTDGGGDPLAKVSVQRSDLPGGESSDGILLSYLAGTVLCLQIAVLASAGFTVLAARRTRQFAMLSAMGARPSQLSMVMRFTGVICGVAGGVLGLAVGSALSIAVTPLLQRPLNHRIHAFDIPWMLLLAMLPLAVISSMAAAWWPSRRVRKTSTMDALAATSPPQTGVAKSLAAGLALAGLGTWLMVKGVPKNSGTWVMAGITMLTVGCLFLAPAAVSILGAAASHLSLPARIAWRDINRNRTRSATATAAAAIAIAVPFGIAAFSASQAQSGIPLVPLSAVLLNNADGFHDADEDSEKFAAVIASVEGARLVPIRRPVNRAFTERIASDHGIDVDPLDAEPQRAELIPFEFEALRSSGEGTVSAAYATPELLAAMNLPTPDPKTDLIVLVETKLRLPDNVTVERHRKYAGIYPEVLIVGDLPGFSRDDVVVYNWVLTRTEPFTQVELDRIESAARRDRSIGILLPDGPQPLTAIRIAALTIAGLLALGVVAVSVALVRVENQSDAVVLNAIGASRRVLRSIGAATALGLVLPAIAIAIPAAFAVLTPIYLNPDEQYDFVVPWPELVAITLVLPAIAMLGGWALTSVNTFRSAN